MRNEDILNKFSKNDDNSYVATLTETEMGMTKLALKTQDAIIDVLDEALESDIRNKEYKVAKTDSSIMYALLKNTYSSADTYNDTFCGIFTDRDVAKEAIIKHHNTCGGYRPANKYEIDHELVIDSSLNEYQIKETIHYPWGSKETVLNEWYSIESVKINETN